MEYECGECGYKFELEDMEEVDSCPECGFRPENCNHPLSYRESEMIRDVGEGKMVERVYCDKCGSQI